MHDDDEPIHDVSGRGVLGSALRLGEDLVRETLQPEYVSLICAPITTLDPSRNVATPRALLVV